MLLSRGAARILVREGGGGAGGGGETTVEVVATVEVGAK